MTISMSEIISQETVRRVEGEGMPILEDKAGAKGDLFITFRIKFPQTLSEEKRQQLKDILG